MTKIVLILILLLASVNVNAQFLDGDELVEDMRYYRRWQQQQDSADNLIQFRTFGYQRYIMGVFDTLVFNETICPPDVDMAQVIAVVEKYIEDNPDRWSMSANFLIQLPLRLAWEC